MSFKDLSNHHIPTPKAIEPEDSLFDEMQKVRNRAKSLREFAERLDMHSTALERAILQFRESVKKDLRVVDRLDNDLI